MFVLSTQLARSFLQASKCRKTNTVWPLVCPVLSGRRWFSEEVPPTTSTRTSEASSSKSTRASTSSSSSKAALLDVSPIAPILSPPKKRTRGPNKPKATLEETAPELRKKRTRKSKTTEAGVGDESAQKTKAKGYIGMKGHGNEIKKPSVLHTSTLALPHVDEWRYYFPPRADSHRRAVTRNPETAKMLAEAFVPEGSKDKIIIDANPGPGQLTRALLALPRERIKKILVIEDVDNYLPFLHSLAEADSRVVVVPRIAKQWDTYAMMEQTGLMGEIEAFGWDQGVNPQLQFIMHISGDTQGEQLVAQLLRAVPDRQWLFKYGRTPLNLIVPERLWKRLHAPPDTSIRCKVSAMCQAVADMSTTIPFEDMQPYSDHFHPRGLGVSEQSDLNRFRSPHRAITVIPFEHPVISSGDLDFWDFCLRKLFVQKAQPLKVCINGLGPGGFNVLPKLTDPDLPADRRIDEDRTPRSLSVHEWSLVVEAFKNWPFRPQQLSIDAFSAASHS